MSYVDTRADSAAAPPHSPQTRRGTAPADTDTDGSALRSVSPSGGEGLIVREGWADPRYDGWTRQDLNPLPDWVTEFRDVQLEAVEQILDAYDRGVKTVFLDAPTGAGKTLIGEMVRRRIAERAVYVCHGLSLQDQFSRDFPYARLLKGRANYPTQTRPFPDVTCADCTMSGPGSSCMWCPEPRGCAYKSARTLALIGKLAVTNTAYLLAEMSGNHSGLAGRDLIIVDEADTLEGILMGAVEFRVSSGMARRLGVEVPGKSVHKPTIVKWLKGDLTDAVDRARKRIRGQGVEQIRERARLNRMMERARVVAGDLEDGLWTRDYGGKKAGDQLDLVLKPIKVDRYGQDRVWRHSDKWLLMSATIISPEEMVDSLGIEGDWEVVRVPMQFPVDRRLIHGIPIAENTAKGREEAWPRIAEGINQVLKRHPGERVVVHTVSFEFAKYLAEKVALGGRRAYRYSGAGDRERIVAQFKASDAGVLFAPSVDRGFDFKGDEARVVVVAKVPFPYLGDRVVSDRMSLDGGQEWYAVQMVRTLVQMTGRGVRSETDYCTTYILDASLYTNVLKRARRLLPDWWMEALNQDITPREFMAWGEGR